MPASHCHHHHHHRTYYRFTSNSASSVLRILEERVFAVGSNHQQDHHHHHQQQRSHWNCCFTLFELLGNMLRVISIKSTKIIPIMIITFSWELLAICLAFFPPSDTFFPYLLSFIQKVSTEVFNLQKRRWGVGGCQQSYIPMETTFIIDTWYRAFHKSISMPFT